MIAARERLLIHLDAWILQETADQRQALADAAGALTQAGRITTVGEAVTRTVRRGCGSPASLLVADDAETPAGGFSAPQARVAPLSRQTAIVHLLETAGGPVRVEPNGRPSVFPLLPRTDPHGRARRPRRSPPIPQRASSSRHSSCENSLAIKCPRKPWGAGWHP